MKSEIKNVNNCLPNRREGNMKTSTLVESVGCNGHTIEIRCYDLGTKVEFRFPWRDQDGKRHFRCCRTLEEARQAAKAFEGAPPKDEQSLPTSNLATKGLTPEMLAEAARILGVSSGSSTSYDQTFSAVADAFLAAKSAKLERGEIRTETYRELESRIRPLKNALGKMKMSELNTERMDKALSALPVSARSVSNCRDKLRGVLRWAVNRNKAPDSILKDFGSMEVTGSKKKDSEKIAPFSRDEVAAILEAARNNRFDPTKANYRIVAVIAMQSFAGLRAAEACKVSWLSIDLGQGIIRLPADIAKTKRARTIEIPTNLRKWLELVPSEHRSGPIYSCYAYSKAQGRLARRVAQKIKGFLWRDNALRQAFIANYIAFSDSISETSFRAGTSESKIRTNYWKLVTKANAVSYFGLLP